jgi:hypothetical protein
MCPQMSRCLFLIIHTVLSEGHYGVGWSYETGYGVPANASLALLHYEMLLNKTWIEAVIGYGCIAKVFVMQVWHSPLIYKQSLVFWLRGTTLVIYAGTSLVSMLVVLIILRCLVVR